MDFWVGKVLVVIGAFSIVDFLLKAFYSDPSDRSYWGIGYLVFAYGNGWAALALQFYSLRWRQWDQQPGSQATVVYRIPLVVLCIAGYLLVVTFLGELAFRRPAIHVMQFLACMLSATLGQFRKLRRTRAGPGKPCGRSSPPPGCSFSYRILAKILPS